MLDRWLGKGVTIAVKNINDLIAPVLMVSTVGERGPYTGVALSALSLRRP